LVRASNLARSRKYQESAELVKQSQQAAAAVSNVPEFTPRLQQLNARLQQAHAFLDKQGIKLPPLQAATSTETTRPLPEKELSFKDHIAPIIVSKCGRCHIEAQRGELSMATFSALEKGVD